MALIQWKDDFSVQVKAFDTHHKKLIDLVNGLHDSMLAGKHQETLGKTLKELHDYTRYHFGEEERLMTRHQFEGYRAHKLRHDNFAAKVQDCIRKYETGKLAMTIDLMNFLRDWLKEHISGTDKNYSRSFGSKGVA